MKRQNHVNPTGNGEVRRSKRLQSKIKVTVSSVPKPEINQKSPIDQSKEVSKTNELETARADGQMAKSIDSATQTSVLHLYESTKLAQVGSNWPRLRLQTNESQVKQIITYIHSDPLAKVHKLLTFDQIFESRDEGLFERLMDELICLDKAIFQPAYPTISTSKKHRQP